MLNKLITDTELRAHSFRTGSKTYPVPAQYTLTPAARDFIKEQGITLVESSAGMSRAPIPMRDGKPVYVLAESGAETTEKGEFLTHLRQNVLVPKTHPRIVLRGKLDSLQGEIILLQTLAAKERNTALQQELGEILTFTRSILGAEVKEEPMPPFFLLGMDSAALRHASHCVEEVFGIPHPIPDCSFGETAARLNCLRAAVRETELAAAAAFSQGERTDLIEALNRLSSAIYILFCKTVSGKGGNRP